MKVLVATEKPFAKVAVDGIRKIVEDAGHTLALLEKYTDVKEFHAAVADADALIVRSDKVTKEVIDAAKQLKIVVRAGAGYDNLDLEACTARNIVAMNTPGQNSNAVAELALGMMIYMARKQFNGTSGTELCGKKLGIHGLGHIGKLIAAMGKGLGMEVYAFAPSKTDEYIQAAGAKPIRDMKEFYATCDYVSLNIPSRPENKKLVNYDVLKNAPKNATLINTARKDVVDEEGILKMLGERSDFKYATDVAPDNAEAMKVFETNYFATPKKMGAQTSEANVNAGLAAANQIVGFFKDGCTTFQVNK